MASGFRQSLPLCQTQQRGAKALSPDRDDSPEQRENAGFSGSSGIAIAKERDVEVDAREYPETVCSKIEENWETTPFRKVEFLPTLFLLYFARIWLCCDVMEEFEGGLKVRVH